MPIYQEIIDLDEAFHQLTEPPIFINELTKSNEKAKEHIKELITTRYTQDMVNILPSCPCGKTKREFSKKTICIYCHKPVKEVFANSIESAVWLRRPEGLERILNPGIWMLLSETFKKTNFNVIDWLTDTKYPTPTVKTQLAVVNKIKAAGIQRGYNNFAKNFHKIVNFLCHMEEFSEKKKNGKSVTEKLLDLINEKKDIIFCEYLPFPSKSFLIVEKTVFSTYVDKLATDAVDAILALTSIDNEHKNQSIQTKENRFARGVSMLMRMIRDYMSEVIASKTGHIRRLMFGSSTNFSVRAVITSKTGNHRYDEIDMPWGPTLAALRPWLLNKLGRLGYSNNQSVALIFEHIEKYSPLLAKLMDDIIAGFPGGKIPVLLNRNPSLLQGSIMLMYGSNVKKDPKDKTIGLPILVVKQLNADFDGDEVHYSFLLDNLLAHEARGLAPKYSLFNMSRPLGIGGAASLPKPVVSAISHMLQY